jgi:transcriptional regulator GlxA family with amidase domain
MARKLFAEYEWEKLVEPAHFNANELARLCGVTPRQLQRQFQQHLRCSPQFWLDLQKLIYAQRLLLAGYSVKNASSESHFRCCSHFCRKFKAHYHMTPSEFVAVQAEKDRCRPEITDGVHR